MDIVSPDRELLGSGINFQTIFLPSGHSKVGVKTELEPGQAVFQRYEPKCDCKGFNEKQNQQSQRLNFLLNPLRLQNEELNDCIKLYYQSPLDTKQYPDKQGRKSRILPILK